MSSQVEILENAIIASIKLDGVDCQCLENYVCVSCGLLLALSPEARASLRTFFGEKLADLSSKVD